MYMNYNQPYLGQQYYRPIQQFDNQYQTMQQPMQQNIQQNQQIQQNNLLGKVVDNTEVVKAMDIPLDGSISYFPIADGSAIVTKQLQSDGTSKIQIFKPVAKEQVQESKTYITKEDVEEIYGKDAKELKEDIKTLKRQIRDITEDMKDIQKYKTRKSDD